MAIDQFLVELRLFFEEYWLIIIAVLIVVWMIAIKKLREMFMVRKLAKLKKIQTENNRIRKKSSVDEIERDFQEWFREKDEGRRSTGNIVEDITKTVKELKDEDNNLDQSIGRDIDELKSRINIVIMKKEQIRSLGKALASLYDKYDDRLAQLNMMLQGMQKINPQEKLPKD